MLQGLLDTPQGLSPEFRVSRGVQTHFAQHWKYHQSQLRAEIIPTPIKEGKFVGGEVT